MVGRLVEDDDIGTGNHHLTEHAAHALTSGEDIDLLQTIVALEEHTAEVATDELGVLIRAVLGQPLDDGVLGCELLRVVLREVGLAGGYAPLVVTAVRLHLAGDDLHEGGLRELVRTNQCDLISTVHDEGDVIEHLYAVDGLREVLHLEDIVTDLTVRLKYDVRILTRGRLDVVELDLLEGTLTGGRLLGFGSIGRETLDELLQLLDLLLLLAVRFLLLTHDELGGLEPEIVVSGEEGDLTVVDVRDVCADLVQEVTVMGYDDDGILEVDEELLEPLNGVQVEVVGRLVEEQDVRVTEQCLREEDLDLFGALQLVHLLIVELGANA